VASLKQRLILTCFMPSIMIAISSEVRTYFETACKLNPARIALIPHGVDISHFRPAPALERDEARASFGIPPDSLVCVLSGRMNFNKGHDILIDAVRRLRETAPALNIICLFPGGGDQAPQIKSYALHDAADATAFRFLGFVDFARLREVYWAADVAVMPSRFEGFGLAMAEAMSCGCVPVRTPGGGWQEQIIEGVNGFIIPFNDPQALADRLLELAGPSRRAAMREKAIAHAQINFSGEKMIAETAALYRRAASTKPSFPRKRESS
jgi:glycosyltransferase involved in cell wall biosynthesis